MCGGGEAGATLVDDRRVDLLSFTGSEARGRQVGMAVAGRFGQSLLELGGNNAAIVLPDANLPLALRTILFSALGTSGQRCTSTRRLLLQESISAAFLTSLVSAYQSASLRMGNPLDPATLVGPLHTPDSVARFEQTIQDIKAQGGQILVGGETVSLAAESGLRGGNWVQPTIAFFPPGRVVPIMQTETFAPSRCCPSAQLNPKKISPR